MTLKTAFVTALLVPLLAACYLPVRFDAEIELGRTGFYQIEFDGYMAKLPLSEEIAAGALSPDEQERKIADAVADLIRDGATETAEYVKDGLFRLKWKRKGDILKDKMVVFMRRNERIFTIKYLKDAGRMVLEGRRLFGENAARVQAAGLDAVGELRVRTDARIIEHNATEVKDIKGEDRMKLYVWKVKSLSDPAPQLSAVLR